MVTKGKRANIRGKEPRIVEFVLNHPDMPRTALAEMMQEQIPWGGKSPEIEVLERKISWYRNHATDDAQDKLWSLATLDKHPIPNDAIPAVLKVWVWRFENRKAFSIREAKWAARLWGVKPDPCELSIMASHYAKMEQIYQFASRPFKSESLDRLLMGLPFLSTIPDTISMATKGSTAVAQMEIALHSQATEERIIKEAKEGGKA